MLRINHLVPDIERPDKIFSLQMKPLEAKLQLN